MGLRLLTLFAAAAFALVACGGDDGSASGSSAPSTTASAATSTLAPASAVAFVLRSSAFADGQPIPKVFTCDGENTSPPLAWAGVPHDTAQLALIVDDPDAPSGNFVHWVTWGFGPRAGEVGKGTAPPNAIQGNNGAGRAGYTGPCPPSGVHHYKFQLFALSAAPDLQPGADSQQLRAAIGAITITSTTLTGTYQRA